MVSSTTVNLGWNINGSYGNGCPTFSYQRIGYKPSVAGSCAGGGWTYQNVNYLTSSYNLAGLLPDTEYCWNVTKINGGRGRASAIWTFRTIDPIDIDSAGLVASTINRCSAGAAVSGILTGNPALDSQINNPVQYQIEVSGNADPIEEVFVAIASDNLQSSFNNSHLPVDGDTSYVYYERLLEVGADNGDRRNTGFQVTNLSGTPSFAMLDSNSSPYFGSSQTSGNLTNSTGTATLRDIGGNTNVVDLGGNSYRITFEVEFDQTYATTDLDFYVSAIERKPDSTRLSHRPFSTSDPYDSNLVAERFTAWAVDSQRPAVSISDPTYIDNFNYNVQWDITDNASITEVRSYCYLGAGGMANVTDNNTSVTNDWDDTVIGYPDADQCSMTSSGVNNRSYTVNSGSINAGLNYEAYAIDNACNVTIGTNQSTPPRPWLSVVGGSAYVGGGFSNVVVPDANGNLSDVGVNLNGNSYISSYLSYIGNNSNALPTDRLSRIQVHTNNYDNQAILPTDFGYSSWSEIILDIAQKPENNLVQTGSSSMGGNLSTAYSVAAGSRIFRQHTGSLTVTSGSVCDVRAVIIVSGNLIIEPDFTRTPTNGCIFVATNNINLTVGTYKSGGVPVGNIANHDIVEAMLIADGTFTVEAEAIVPGQTVDAVYIHGSVFGGSVNFNRDLGVSQASIQPAELIEYDPFYFREFGDTLTASEFSLRGF